jgi:putative ABC transport system substrate-binding protein
VATVAVQRETRTIPIVLIGVTDPVATDLVPRLNQPGGNITGFAGLEPSLAGKWLELLSEIAPGLKRAAVMFNPDTVEASALSRRNSSINILFCNAYGYHRAG